MKHLRRAVFAAHLIAGTITFLSAGPAQSDTQWCWENAGVGGGVTPVDISYQPYGPGYSLFVCTEDDIYGVRVNADAADPAAASVTRYHCLSDPPDGCNEETTNANQVAYLAALPPRGKSLGVSFMADPLGPAGAQPQCTGIVFGSFNEVQDVATRVISGQWQFSASMDCNRDDMDTLHVEAILYDEVGNAHNGNVGTNNCFGGPLHPGSGSCRSVSDAGIHGCFVCNGTWFADGEFDITLPIGWVWLPTSEDGECRIREPRTLHCSVSTGPIVLQ